MSVLDRCAPWVEYPSDETNGSPRRVLNVSTPNHCLKNYCTPLHLCQMYNTPAVIPIHGYLLPILIILAIVNNTLVCVVLLKKSMRSPTNSLLVSLAIADTLTGSCALPVFTRFYMTRSYLDYVPYDWCYAVHSLGVHIPTVFHTASIWLTVGLAVQRYIYVCHSFIAKRFCNVSNVIKGTALVYVTSTLMHLSRFFEYRYVRVGVPSLLNSDAIVYTCLPVPGNWLNDLYFNIYFWMRVLIVHIVPCAGLVVINALLISALNNANRRRKILFKQNRRTESRLLGDTNRTTSMLLVVVSLFLLVEVPMGIFILLYVIQNTLEIPIMTQAVIENLMIFLNLFILVSYPLNFFIYCGMSRQFRSNFKGLFVKSAQIVETDGYVSMLTDNIKTRPTVEETHL